MFDYELEQVVNFVPFTFKVVLSNATNRVRPVRDRVGWLLEVFTPDCLD